MAIVLNAPNRGSAVVSRRSRESGPLLEPLGIVQVPGEAGGLWIRNDPVTSERQLVVCNTYGGIRILRYRP